MAGHRFHCQGCQTIGAASGTFSFFDYAEEIESAVLLVHGEKAYSRYASEKVMKLLNVPKITCLATHKH